MKSLHSARYFALCAGSLLALSCGAPEPHTTPYTQLPVAHVPPAARVEHAQQQVARAPTPDAPFRAHAPAPDATPTFHPPHIEQWRMANGIGVLLVERHDLPIVTVRYLTRRGSDDAPVGKAGLASMTGVLLDRGTTTRDSLALSDAFLAIGAEHATWVGWDSGGASVKALAPNLEPALGLLADIVQHPAFAPAELERIRAQRLASIQQERDVPQLITSNVIANTVYGSAYPYGHSLSGDEASVRSITRDDVLRYYHAHFVPQDSAIVLVGDVTRAQAEPVLARAFGAWRGHAPAAHALAHPAALPATGARIFVVDRPGAPQSQVAVANVGAPRSSTDYAAATVMNAIFGGMFSSRINLNLRETHAYTYGAHSAFAFRHGAGPFAVGGAIAVANTAAAIREIFNELRRIRSSDVTTDELAVAKARIIESLPAAFETTDQTAEAVAAIFAYGLPLDEYATMATRINAVTAADVRRAAEHYLDPDHARIVVVGDRAVIEQELRALGLGDVEVRDATGLHAAPPVAGASTAAGAGTTGTPTH